MEERVQTYINGQTPIMAEALNAIQDAIIENSTLIGTQAEQISGKADASALTAETTAREAADTAEATARAAADTTLTNELDDVKSAVNYLTEGVNYLHNYRTIPNEYPDVGGFTPQSNWTRSDYIPVTGGEKVYIYNPSRASSDNVWYDENKNYIAKFSVAVGSPTEVTAPANAKYFIISNRATEFYGDVYLNNPIVEDIRNNITTIFDTFEKANDFNYALKKYDVDIAVTPRVTTLVENFEKTVNGRPTLSTAGVTTANIDARFDVVGGHSAVGVGSIKCLCYIENVSNITTFTLSLADTTYQRSIDVGTLKNGWNVLEFFTSEGDLTNWSTISWIRVYVARTSTTGLIYFGKFIFNKPSKASLIFVEDGVYKDFYDYGYPDFVSLGVPLTWATCPTRIGNDALSISSAEFDVLKADPLSEFSFHSWDSTPESSATELAVRTSAIKCIRFLQSNGILPEYPWRAATIQNNSPHVGALKDYLFATATGNSKAGYTYFPFPSPFNVDRKQLHGMTESDLTELFTTLEKTHCTVVLYTHRIADDSPTDTSPALWNTFITDLTAAISAGYLNVTTFNSLMMDYYNPLLE